MRFLIGNCDQTQCCFWSGIESEHGLIDKSGSEWMYSSFQRRLVFCRKMKSECIQSHFKADLHHRANGDHWANSSKMTTLRVSEKSECIHHFWRTNSPEILIPDCSSSLVAKKRELKLHTSLKLDWSDCFNHDMTWQSWQCQLLKKKVRLKLFELFARWSPAYQLVVPDIDTCRGRRCFRKRSSSKKSRVSEALVGGLKDEKFQETGYSRLLFCRIIQILAGSSFWRCFSRWRHRVLLYT